MLQTIKKVLCDPIKIPMWLFVPYSYAATMGVILGGLCLIGLRREAKEAEEEVEEEGS